jgi:hypothetical protein
MLLPFINLRPRAAPPLLYVPVLPDDGIRQQRAFIPFSIQRHGVPVNGRSNIIVNTFLSLARTTEKVVRFWSQLPYQNDGIKNSRDGV